MASEICSCGYPVLEYMQQERTTRGSVCEAYTREMQSASSCRECGRQQTLETGINVPLRALHKTAGSSGHTRLDRLLQKRRDPKHVYGMTMKLSSYFPSGHINSLTSFFSVDFCSAKTFFSLHPTRKYSIYLN